MSGYNIKNIVSIVFFCLKICFTYIYSVDPDEMPQYVPFHLGLYCLYKYQFKGFPYTKG